MFKFFFLTQVQLTVRVGNTVTIIRWFGERFWLDVKRLSWAWISQTLLRESSGEGLRLRGSTTRRPCYVELRQSLAWSSGLRTVQGPCWGKEKSRSNCSNMSVKWKDLRHTSRTDALVSTRNLPEAQQILKSTAVFLFCQTLYMHWLGQHFSTTPSTTVVMIVQTEGPGCRKPWQKDCTIAQCRMAAGREFEPKPVFF